MKGWMFHVDLCLKITKLKIKTGLKLTTARKLSVLLVARDYIQNVHSSFIKFSSSSKYKETGI